MRIGRRNVSGLLAMSIGCWLALAPGVATAAEPSVYATWTIADAGGLPAPNSGSVSVPATGFPQGTWSDEGVASVEPGDQSYLTEDTPFGNVFGSSQGKPYAELGPAPGDETLPGAQPATATIDFGYPTPASGWGFSIGFVEQGTLQIEARDAEGNPVDADGIGWQGAFNYCAATPTPPSCSGFPVGVIPAWEPTTMSLIGAGTQGHGPSGWFMPTVSLSSISFTYTPVSDPIPTYELWIADSVATISGQVQMVDASGGTSPYEGATLFLLDTDGDPVLDANGNPVATQSGADGTYSFPGLARASYTVALDTSTGLQPLTPDQQPANAENGDVSGVDFQLRATPAAQPTTPTTPPAEHPGTGPQGVVSPTTAPGAPESQPQLAATGTDNTTELTVAGLGLLAVGAALVAGVRLRKH